jgi:hypothetical protein
VGLQVFEHLTGQQRIAFNEVRRVARHAIISLPIEWDKKDPTHSHHMIMREQVQAWFDPVKPNRILEGTPAPACASSTSSRTCRPPTRRHSRRR